MFFSGLGFGKNMTQLHMVLKVKTIKVGNIARTVSAKEIRDFFSFSGKIKYVEMQR